MAHVILIGTQSWSEHSALVLQMAMLGRLLLTKVVIADSSYIRNFRDPDRAWYGSPSSPPVP